jgi:hypothetical protein
MVDKKNSKKEFISYLDDDGQHKDQWVLITKKNQIGVEFRFNIDETQVIFIPWNRILKIKGEKYE